MSNSPYIFDATADNFQQKVMEASATTPILVDVWAEWCAPCKQLMPILQKLAEEYQGNFQLAKVNADEQQELTASRCAQPAHGDSGEKRPGGGWF